ncbi:insulinase family protein [Vaginisenegalia massiliensis]|uniref:insulinase family protein n=1 Tax=Vaginisenegalia massiliensis TaxID=2058294 RepID=UPI000F544F51|nr:insulinase family protein [Vaginisenegalia massiliensis]
MTFKLIEEQELDDIQSHGYLYEHTATGAQVLYLKNGDSNKAFTIAFKTPPYDDNGIAHIIEHSVLNGSQKFPSKEPFVELVKGSLNTFVNAMTSPDKTSYPVASTNDKDFRNLMEVYLDAVFAPNLYHDPQILQQEGWHYHLENADDPLIYKGVVYNEMKGAMASAETQLYWQLGKALYPNSVYQHESGGLPSAIPTLTQEKFVAFHQEYYHPSNSLTILYGDIQEQETFDLLAEYFDRYQRQDKTVDLRFEVQEPATKAIHESYSITQGDDPQDKDYLALAWHVGTVEDSLDNLAMKILGEVLLGTNQAPLKKALLDAEIGGYISGSSDEWGFTNVFDIMAKYSSSDKMPQFKEVVETTLQQLVKDKIPRDLIQAAINKVLFGLKEMVISESNPRGVIYAMTALSTWLYGESPFEALSFSALIEQVNQKMDQDYFENLIQEKLLNNPVRVEICLEAEPGKSDRQEAQLMADLQAYKASLSEDQLADLIQTTQALIERQESGDRPEDLAKIPTLTKADLTTDTEDLPLIVTPLADMGQFFFAPQFTSGIDYLHFMFDLSDLAMDDFLHLSLVAKLLGKLPTDHYSVADLQTAIDLHTGGISAGISLYESQSGQIKPYFIIRTKALENQTHHLLDLVKEILLYTQWQDDKEILKVVQNALSNFEQAVDYRAHSIAANRVVSQMSPNGKLAELISGIDQYFELKHKKDQLQTGHGDEVKQVCARLMDRVIVRPRLSVLYVGQESRLQTITDLVNELGSALKPGTMGPATVFTAGVKQNEAFIASQDVNYVAQGTDVHDILPYTGQVNVLATILRYDYLWNNIRVKGGAYGASYNLNRQGHLTLASYRDPNLGQTLTTYQGLASYIDQVELSDEALLKYMIGTMSALDRPLAAIDKGLKALNLYLSDLTVADLIRQKEEVLATSQADIRAFAPTFAKAVEAFTTVVIGNKVQIEQEQDRFDQIKELC